MVRHVNSQDMVCLPSYVPIIEKRPTRIPALPTSSTRTHSPTEPISIGRFYMMGAKLCYPPKWDALSKRALFSILKPISTIILAAEIQPIATIILAAEIQNS